ncbi:MAG: ATP-binding cassette domain-containing protein [Candidatus Microbacterium phytovorans]|uniref:ATP-binding cassette domain-containing protein n=1 Tax=Candidatus Microbacterium phytovorans TaxID=3121374 RepID=A0AAJ6B3V9_9MICO|nr:ATP-binding cassette domain-containing protein [Microbacterium sp.]WEK13627.1 MAG: ATP-binding cassette domain-containing protein [Microbacterium sp.]
MLRVDRLRKSFEGRKIFDLTFTLGPGEFCVLLGENGVGKTTLFRCLLRLENYDGSVHVEGTQRRDAFFGVLDQPMMYAAWTASQNIRYLLNDSNAHLLPPAARLLEPSWSRAKVGRLSTGQRKMVLLAAALASRATIVLFDEFANGLDQGARALFRESVREQLRKGERSFIATGHDLRAFGDLPSRVLAMRDGSLTDVTEAYLARRDMEEVYEAYVARTDP